jgi:alkanesulfonate monooxygenase SsuD/methylene tetrahydromethanopterin reductase-like flavin-dependent oxidoreductase (luciferase family)
VVVDVSFGLFEWVDRGEVPVTQLYEDRLRVLEAADAAGFHCYHLAEHHATPLGMAPSPSVFLAAASQRTERIRLGSLAHLLPLYDPLRLSEEICMLDHLSRGRLDVGVSRGVSPYELAYFGVDASGTRPLFHEALSVIRAALSSDRLTYESEHYHYEDVPMELRPLQQPYPPLWYPTTTLESMPFVGGNGFNFVALGPAGFVRPLVDEYWRHWAARRDDPARLNGHVAAPKVGLNRQIVVADTDEEAEAITRSAHGYWYNSILRLWWEHGDHSNDGLFDWRGAVEHETIIFGSPERVREKVARALETSGCNYLSCCFAWGNLTHEQTLRSLRLFASEVMPAFVSGAELAGAH